VPITATATSTGLKLHSVLIPLREGGSIDIDVHSLHARMRAQLEFSKMGTRTVRRPLHTCWILDHDQSDARSISMQMRLRSAHAYAACAVPEPKHALRKLYSHETKL
jgi:hypothetical protein